MTSMTELLCKLLDERGVEYETDERNAITKWSTHYGAFVFFARQREGKLLVETTVATEHSVILTPEQAIAATLGSDRERALESLLRDWKACDPRCTNRSCGDCEHDEDDGCGLYRRMCELGVIA